MLSLLTKNSFFLFFTLLIFVVHCKKFKEEEKPKWAKKDVRDYTEADLERLLDQWDVSNLT